MSEILNQFIRNNIDVFLCIMISSGCEMKRCLCVGLVEVCASWPDTHVNNKKNVYV